MEPSDLAELASLYALDALEEEEQSWVVSHADQVPELGSQMDRYRTAASLLFYGAPSIPLPAHLKTRLFQQIAAEAAASPAVADLIEQSQTVHWEPYTPMPGIWLGKLLIDAERREIQCFVRSWSAATFPRHRHLAEEEIIVLEGDLSIGDCQYQSGDRITSPRGTIHQPQTQKGCLIFLRTCLDDQLLP